MNILKLFFCFMLASTLVGCVQQATTENRSEKDTDSISAAAVMNGEAMPIFSFEKEEHDFGKITQGEVVSYHFKFTNVGDADLLISSAKASCGCAIPEYSTDPIAVGGKGVIEVKFDTHGKRGFQNKVVSLMANTIPNKKELIIKAMIYLPDEEQ